MAFYEIPLAPVPAQSFGCVLSNQNCSISVYMRGKNFYFDLALNGRQIYQGELIALGESLTPYRYLNFVGDIRLVDLDNKNDGIDFELFGSRFVLIYSDGK